MPDNRGGPEVWGYQMPQRMPARNAIGALVGGIIADADQARFQTQRDAWIEAGAQRLEAIGTPRAAQLASKLRDNPAAIHMMVKQRGGWPALEAGLQAEAENMRFSQVMEQNAAGAYSDPSSFVAAMTAAGMDPGRAAQVWSTLRPGEQGPLVEVADPGSPTGTRWVTREQAIGQAGKPPTGMRLEIGPDGTIIQTGVRGGGDTRATENLQKTTRTLVEKDVVKAMGQMQAIRNVMSEYEPEYQQLPEQAKQWALSKKEWLGWDLTPEQKQRKMKYMSYRSDVFDELNVMINALSGAAVSVQEMKRLQQSMPNLDDSPTDFEAKAYALRRRVAQATARGNYVLREGLTIGDLPLGRMDDVMKSRGNRYHKEFMEQGMSPEDAKAATDQKILSEFGVTYDEVVFDF